MLKKNTLAVTCSPAHSVNGGFLTVQSYADQALPQRGSRRCTKAAPFAGRNRAWILREPEAGLVQQLPFPPHGQPPHCKVRTASPNSSVSNN